MAKKPAAKKSAKKAPAKKPAARKPAMKAAAKKSAPKKAAKKPAKKPAKKAGPTKASNAKRSPWFDAANKPLIAEYAQRLQPYIDAMADGRIDEGELAAQEKRLTDAMRDVEPQLDGYLHGKVTRLLCEMAAYDLMQTLSVVQEARPQTVFHG